MKCTIVASPAGVVFMTVPHADTSLFIGKAKDITRIGNISETDNGIAVEFLSSALSEFNKDGFADYDSAIAYEQDILDTNLPEKFLV